ncbi:MAG: hypothetical protein LBS61_01485 [Endomicrobium sp.]|nr:hypothetical protein [Endomicrobium sp.]
MSGLIVVVAALTVDIYRWRIDIDKNINELDAALIMFNQIRDELRRSMLSVGELAHIGVEREESLYMIGHVLGVNRQYILGIRNLRRENVGISVPELPEPLPGFGCMPPNNPPLQRLAAFPDLQPLQPQGASQEEE